MMESHSQIDAQSIYEFTGNPSPNFLQKVLDILLNKEVSHAF